MQTIWSRLAQVGGDCGCPQCLHSLQGVSRRATASTLGRTSKHLTSSTLWYSGIFAVVATYDSAAKKRRREQWDQAIAEAKHGLDRQEKQLADGVQEQFNKGSVNIPLDALATGADVFDKIEPFQRRPKWPTNTGPALNVHRLPPESIYATEERKGRAEKRRWTPKKLETVMLSVDMLQMEIFMELQRQGWHPEATSSLPPDYAENMPITHLELLAAIKGKKSDLRRVWKADPELTEYQRSEGDVPLSKYQQDDQGNYHYIAHQLAHSLRSLFKQHANALIDRSTLLVKLAHNLSISSAPPDINTYNTLLLGFSQSGHSDLAYKTIRSLRATHVRPNEVTNAAILRHYTDQDDMDGFVHWIELMRGKHEGLALARPDVYINDAGKSRLVRKEGEPDKIIQLPYPTPNVFGSVLQGVLKFGGFDTALRICQSMTQEGWGLCMSGLGPLLRDCSDRGDWTSGLAVWQQIQALRARSRRFEAGRWIQERIGLDTFAAMLRLCSNVGQRDTFDAIWQQASNAHRGSATKLAELVRAQSRIEIQSAPTMSQYEESPHRQEAQSAKFGQGLDECVDSASNMNEELPSALSNTTEHQDNVATAGRVLEELQPEKRTAETSWTVEANDDRSVIAKDEEAPRPALLLREQLDGLLPSYELDDYELRERPMTING